MPLIISSKLYHNIIYDPIGYNKETGGFLGIKNNAIINYVFDEGMTISNVFMYRPNSMIFNIFVSKCIKNKVEQFGILHTHLNQNETLSNNDREFIHDFFDPNPHINQMYFPVVIPGELMRIYIGKRNNRKVNLNVCEMSLYL